MKGFKKDAAHRRKPARKRRPVNVLASCLTVMSLYCGMASIFAAIGLQYEKAAWWILGAIICDALDGSVAKLTNSVTEFGKQLDSLCDLVSFGAAPAVLIFTTFLLDNSPLAPSLASLDPRIPHVIALASTPDNPMVTRVGALMAGIFVICGALRLARYNAYQSEAREYFTGLPIPAAGGIVASFVLFAHYFELTVTIWFLGPLTLALAALMVSTIKYPKDRIKSALLSPRHAFRFILLAGVAIAAVGAASQHSPAAALFPLGAMYVLLGIGNAVYERVTKPRTAAQPVPPSKPSGSVKSAEPR